MAQPSPPIHYSFVNYRNARLYYVRMGRGPKVLVAFHGFGQISAHFHRLAQELADEYTLYAFDLFFHGRSQWQPRRQLLSKQFWAALMDTFFTRQQISRFSLLGFSMGGKFVLATLEHFPERVQELILIAPDGVNTSFWYRLATTPGWTHTLFKRIIIRPALFQRMAVALHNLKIVDKGLVRFAQSQMNTREKRIRVYYSWVIFRKLQFNMRRIAHLINTFSIPTYMYLGEYDRVIPLKSMRILVRRLPKCNVVMLKAGHSHLIEEVARYYAQKKGW